MKLGNLNLRELSQNQMLEVSGGGKKGAKGKGNSGGNSSSGGCGGNSSSGNSGGGGCGCGTPPISPP
jgi:hypothetical protein